MKTLILLTSILITGCAGMQSAGSSGVAGTQQTDKSCQSGMGLDQRAHTGLDGAGGWMQRRVGPMGSRFCG